VYAGEPAGRAARAGQAARRGPRATRPGGRDGLDRDDGDDRVRSACGGNYGRLQAIKHKYDPHNFFRLNPNIKPAG
jgi:hypothetical protein